MRIVYLVLIILVFSNCSWTYNYVRPSLKNDGLQTGPISQTKLDTIKISQMISEIQSNKYPNIHSILIVKDQKLVLEEYFNGYTDTTLHDLRSAGKSIESAITGIAIDKGFLKSEDEFILDRFNYSSISNLNSYKQAIQIKHLLNMTSGLNCGDIRDYKNHSGYVMHFQKDPIKYYLDLKAIHKPGTFFNYNDSEPYVIATINYLSSGMSQKFFIDQFLFKPLNIFVPGLGDQLKPRDMAKFGLLYLNKGKWNGKQIISEKWIEKSTKNQVYWGEKHIKSPRKKFADGYGYYWWIKSFQINNQTFHSYFAAGNGGQYIFVFPDLDMVIVFTGGNYNNPKANQTLDIIQNYILNTKLTMSL